MIMTSETKKSKGNEATFWKKLKEYNDVYKNSGKSIELVIDDGLKNLKFDESTFYEFRNSLHGFTGVEYVLTIIAMRVLHTHTKKGGLKKYNNGTYLKNQYVEHLDGEYEGHTKRFDNISNKIDLIKSNPPVTNIEKCVYMISALIDYYAVDVLAKRSCSISDSLRSEDTIHLTMYLEYFGYIACILEEEDSDLNEAYYNDLYYYYRFLSIHTGIEYPLTD